MALVENKFGLQEAMQRAVTDMAYQPLFLAKTLQQLGFEPLPATSVRTFTGRFRMMYPNTFTYLGYIRRRDGWFGMYRGLSGKMTTSLTAGFIYTNSRHYLVESWAKPRQERRDRHQQRDDIDEDETTMREALPTLLDGLIVETCARSLAIVVSHPFHVVTIRLCAEFVGSESNTLSISQFARDLLSGNLFSGLLPRLLADLILIWGTQTTVFFVSNAIGKQGNKSVVNNYISMAVNFILQSHLYPYHLVSTIMAINQVPPERLQATLLNPPLENWLDCWRYLSLSGCMRRGASIIWRYQSDVNRTFVHSGAKSY